MTLKKYFKKARNYIGSILDKADDVKKSGKGVAYKFICGELPKMPVPFIGSAIAAIFCKGDRSAEEISQREFNKIITILQEMKTSDEALDKKLNALNKEWPEIKENTEIIIALILEQQEPCFKVARGKTNLKYPIDTNEITFLLANVGGGSILVDEIYLEIEKFEPETKIEYSVPAAALPELHLKAKLSIDEWEYPLLEINNQTERIFAEQGIGAEKVIINLTSLNNARYYLRIRIPYLNLRDNTEDTIYYPPKEEDPIEVPFCYAPGWNIDIKPENLLEKNKMLENIETKFNSVISIIEEVQQTDLNNTEQLEQINNKLKNIEINGEIGKDPTFGSVVKSFVPTLEYLTDVEGKPEVLEVIPKVLSSLSKYEPKPDD